MTTKNDLVNYYLACHYNGTTIGQAKKLLLQSNKYSASEIDQAAKIAAQELLKTTPTPVKKKEAPVLQNVKTAAQKNNFNAAFWLISTAFILIIIAIIFLYSLKSN